MNTNNITVTEAQVQEMLDLTGGLQEKVAVHTITITENDKHSLPKMGDGHLPFVLKALELAKQNPALVPQFVNVTDLTVEADAAEMLGRVYQPLKQMCDMLHNTIIVAGSDAYVGSLAFYNAAKGAAKSGVPGAQTVFDELSKHFTNRGHKSNTQTPPVNP